MIMELSYSPTHSLLLSPYSRNIPVHVNYSKTCKPFSHHRYQNTNISIIKPTHKLSDHFSFKYFSTGLSSFGVQNGRRIGLNNAWGGFYRPNFIRSSSQVEAAGSDPIPNTLSTFTKAFFRFLRPYSLYETIIASVCMVARSWLTENPNLLNRSLPLNAFIGFFALFCLHVYYVGINQIFDVDIDRVNKPELPIAAGDLSLESAWLLVIAFAVNGLLIVGLKGGPFLTCLYSLGLFVATAYSAPPFRLKRFAIGPMFTIVMMRGILLNIGLHCAARAAIGLAFKWTAPLVFIVTSATLFATAISVTKDLSDIEGDSQFEISTLVSKLGVRNTAFLGSGLILMNYGVGIMAAVFMPQVFRRSIIIPAHIILASYLIFRARALDQANYSKEASLRFYLFIWDLLYAQFLMYPFI